MDFRLRGAVGGNYVGPTFAIVQQDAVLNGLDVPQPGESAVDHDFITRRIRGPTLPRQSRHCGRYAQLRHSLDDGSDG